MVVIEKHGFRDYKFTVVAVNGKEVGRSSSVSSVKRIQRALEHLDVEGLQVTTATEGCQYYFVLTDPHSGIKIYSQYYKEERSLQKGIASVKNNIKSQVVRLLSK